jgi:hypothetical protein
MPRTSLRTALILLASMAAPAGAQQTRPQSSEFTWSAPATRGMLVRVKNVRGAVSVVRSQSDSVEVVGLKVWRRGNPAAVNILTHRQESGEGTIVICALWGAVRDCDGRISRADSRAVGDVSVELTVKIPEGMRLAVTNVNGDVSVETDSRVLVAETTNGNVVVQSSEGTVAASTVNGSVTAYLTEPVHATVDLRTRGRLQSDFAVAVTGAMRPGRLQGRIGNGGRRIELQSARGEIALRRRGRGPG